MARKETSFDTYLREIQQYPLLTADQLEERLASLQLLRDRYVTYRDEARRRAADFLRLAGDVP